jgi:hypothetical protein
MQKGVVVQKGKCAMDGVAIAIGLVLRNKPDRRGVRPRGLRIRCFIAGANYHCDFLDSCRQRLLDQYLEQRLLLGVTVNKNLKRQ